MRLALDLVHRVLTTASRSCPHFPLAQMTKIFRHINTWLETEPDKSWVLAVLRHPQRCAQFAVKLFTTFISDSVLCFCSFTESYYI